MPPRPEIRERLTLAIHPEVLVNIVTSSECDEATRCPEYIVVDVDVEKITAPVKQAATVRQPEPAMV